MTISNNPPLTRTHDGIEIEFDQQRFKFVIHENLDADQNGWPRESSFASFDEAVEAIKEWRSRIHSAEKRALATKFPMQTPDGLNIIVRGINRRNGQTQVDGSTKSGRKLTSIKGEFYPRHDFIQPLLAEKRRLDEASREIERVLYNVRVSSSGHHHGIDAAYYDRVLGQFAEKIEKAIKYADEYAAKQEAAKEAQEAQQSDAAPLTNEEAIRWMR